MSLTLTNWHLAAAVALPTIVVLLTNQLRKNTGKDRHQNEDEDQYKAKNKEDKPIVDQKEIEHPQPYFPIFERICFIGTGVLTACETSYCVLNFNLKFEKYLLEEIFKNSLDRGSTIKYLAYKRQGVKELEIIKAISVENEYWDANIDENELKKLIENNKMIPRQQICTQVEKLKCQVVDRLPSQHIVLNNENNLFKVKYQKFADLEIPPNIGDDIEITAIFPDQNSQLRVILEVIHIKPLLNTSTKVSEERWVEIRWKPLQSFTCENTTQIMQVFVINQRSNPLTLMNIELLTLETRNKHPYIKLLKPELYVNCFQLKGNTEHLMELEVQNGIEESDSLQLVLTFDRFKLKRILGVVSKIEKNGFVNSRYQRSNLAESYKRRFTVVKMPDYEVAESLFKAFMNKKTNAELTEYVHIKNVFLNAEMNMKNYKPRFQLLLHLEEMEIYKLFRKYDCTQANFLKEGDLLVLCIEGLLERRPSLCIGDIVRINTENKKKVDGVIQKVLMDRIHIKFNDQFHSSYMNEAYDLEFYFSRMNLRKLHHGISLMARRQSNLLFPTKLVSNEKLQLPASLEEGDLLIGPNKYNWFNNVLNISQKRAVCNVLRGEMAMPYCIFGPPGTGKTVTIVETILQLRKHVPNSCILVAAPSNSAANMIAMRLLKCNQQIQFLRLVSYSHMESDLIPTELIKNCAKFENGIQSEISRNSNGILNCSNELLSKTQLLIGTCMTLGGLMQTKFSVNHFTHAIIDEAAQCNEPELMCVVALLASKGQLILSGDHQQLPPLIMNPLAKKEGLSTSYMERVLELEPYTKNKQVFPNTNGYDSRLVTMLIYNYRSLPSILNFYNYLFYDQELIAVLKKDNPVEVKFLEAGKATIREMGENIQAKELPQYHGTYICALKSVNMKALDSPSWYNEVEAKHVYCTTLALIERGINVDDIGIITPYLKQVRFLRCLFQNEDDSAIPKIGTIEEFQGQERSIILISTVRTKEAHMKEDRRQCLGFLSAPSRLNVSISRARALVIVFGNPSLLSKDEHWLTYIQYCYTNNTCYGDADSLTILKEIMANNNEQE